MSDTTYQLSSDDRKWLTSEFNALRKDMNDLATVVRVIETQNAERAKIEYVTADRLQVELAKVRSEIAPQVNDNKQEIARMGKIVYGAVGVVLVQFMAGAAFVVFRLIPLLEKLPTSIP